MESHINDIKFIGSFPEVDMCPKHRYNEYAFIGRSNVGKSSLINYLSNNSSIAKTSKKPGKTQLINMFLVDGGWCMVDLPGYGYAVASKKNRKIWMKMIYSYLESRQNLINTFVLLDSRIDLQKNDLEFINWLGTKGIPFSLIYTKIDGIKKSQFDRQLEGIKNALLQYWEELPRQFNSSTASKIGRKEILEYITHLNSTINFDNE